MTNPLPTFGPPPASGSYYNQVSSGHGWFVQTIPAWQYSAGDLAWHFEGDGPFPRIRHDDLINNYLWRLHGKTVIYWYTGRVTGEPRFMFAMGEAGAELDLFEIVGGTIMHPEQGVETLVGQCRFTGDIFAFRLDGIRSGIRVEPVVLAETSCIYYYKPRRGEGIIAQFFGDRCAIGFWTYRANAIGVRHTDTWYAFEGEATEEGFYALIAYETKGAFQTAGLKTEVIGTGSLTMLNDNAAQFRFVIGNRSETYEMEKLF